MSHPIDDGCADRSAQGQPDLPPIILDPDLESARDPGAAHLNGLHVLWVLLGGIIGSFCRQALTTHYPPHPGGLPWAVLLVNASGCLAIGLVGGAFFERDPSRVAWRLFVVTGILGGWTTYSALAAEFLLLNHHGSLGAGFLLIAISLVANIGLAGLGLGVGRQLIKDRSA